MHNLQLRKEAQKHGKSPGKVPLFYMGKNAGYRWNTCILVNFVIYKRKNVEKYRTKV